MGDPERERVLLYMYSPHPRPRILSSSGEEPWLADSAIKSNHRVGLVAALQPTPPCLSRHSLSLPLSPLGLPRPRSLSTSLWPKRPGRARGLAPQGHWRTHHATRYAPAGWRTVPRDGAERGTRSGRARQSVSESGDCTHTHTHRGRESALPATLQDTTASQGNGGNLRDRVRFCRGRFPLPVLIHWFGI
jgi:hypothetical protein